jgi:hydroxyethylthiazole kinase-like uncharacterized protein yjeF
MKIFQCRKIKELDRYTIEHEPIESIALMERAAVALTAAITKRWDSKIPFVVFAGPGNNGGDALAVARLLAEKGYRVEAYLFNTADKISDECKQNRDLLAVMENITFTEIIQKFIPPHLSEEQVIVDGLFGSGLNKPLTGGFAGVVKYINASPAKVVAIDIPSGLNGDGNRFDVYPNIIIKADLTLTLQLPKLAFYFSENENILGEWEVLDIGLSKEGIEKTATNFSMLEEEEVKAIMRPRKKFAHKGDFGHALLIAGSYGMAGASVLTARACIRSGVGLLTVHAPSENVPILQTSVPEAMVESDIDQYVFSTPTYSDDYQAIGIGPGLGLKEETVSALLEQIKECQSPMVLDADALNILSLHKEALPMLPVDTILTPHPKELERLTGKCSDSYERLQKAIELACATKSYIVLKGAYSAIVSPDGCCLFNPTGNPGMATGGSGDVLTGIILALLSQGYSGKEAAIIGTYVHGLAGDIAASKWGMIGMTATSIVDALPSAWKQLINK